MKIIDETKSVWYERYKPQIVQDLIIPESFKRKLMKYIETQDIPNIGFFSSCPGTGKSSTSNAVLNDLNCEAIWINASIEKGIDVVRGKISKFASQSSFDGGIKVVVLDESDALSPDAQKAFRGFIDEFSQNCRFIFTGNYKEKIIQPLLDRLEVHEYESFSKEELVKPIFERLRFILDNEEIQYDPKALVPVINTYFPSIRSMVGALQKFSTDGVFSVDENELDELNVFDNVMKLVQPSTYTDMIQSINDVSAPDNLYSYLYKNAGKYFKPEVYPNVVLCIAKYQSWADGVRDKNLNAAACLTELMKLK